MKTIKQSMLLLAASFAATISFAQVGLGVANSTRATTKALNVNATTRVAANAATRTTNATKTTVSTTTATAALAKNTLKQNAGARINAQADVHAAEQAKLHANENAAAFGTQTNADVTVDGAAAADKVEQKVVKTKDKVTAEKDATVKTTKKVKAKTETRVKAEAHAKSQAAEHASEQALEHANDHSAVFGATSETEATTDVKANRNDVSADGKVKTNTKAKGQVKKG